MTATDDDIAKLEEALAKATPGPWSVWRERTETRFDAIAELRAQVEHTEQFSGELFLLDARGKCPATTGCGPTSKANATAIVAAVNLAPALIARLRAAEAERDEAEGALVEMVHAAHGFAEAVRHHAGKAYPWPALDIAKDRARPIVLSRIQKEEGHEG